MNVSLTPRLEAMIREKVESGMYNNASEVVREALRLLEQHDRERRLREELALGVEQIERGETVRWTPELLQTLKEQSVAAATAGEPMSDAVTPDDLRERERWLREALAVAVAQLDRGEGIPVTPKRIARIKWNAAEHLKNNRPFKDAVVPEEQTR